MRRHSFRQRRTDAAPPTDMIFGLNPVQEVLVASPQLIEKMFVVRGVQVGERLLVEARRQAIAVETIERGQLDVMTSGGHHQGVAVRAKPFAFVALEDVLRVPPSIVVVLDGITDPQNVGAILRSAEVLGAGALVLPKDRSAGISPTVMRASSGAAVFLPIAQVVNVVRGLERIKDAGYWTVGLDASGASRFRDLPSTERTAIVIGGEGKGIRPLVARACDFLVAIPVRGRVASLNAAAAAAIGIHELASRLAPPGAAPRQ